MKKLFDPASLKTKGGRQTLISDVMPRLLPKPPGNRRRTRPGSGALIEPFVEHAREDREQG